MKLSCLSSSVPFSFLVQVLKELDLSLFLKMKKKLQSLSSSVPFSFLVTSFYHSSRTESRALEVEKQNCSCITKQFCCKVCNKLGACYA